MMSLDHDIEPCLLVWEMEVALDIEAGEGQGQHPVVRL